MGDGVPRFVAKGKSHIPLFGVSMPSEGIPEEDMDRAALYPRELIEQSSFLS